MEDNKIIDMYFVRSEKAITETQNKYGAYCRSIAHNILFDRQDEEECENDTYLCAWNSIPPQKPLCLSSFLGRITRNLALNKLKARNRQKRKAGEYVLSLEELSQTLGEDKLCIEDKGESDLSDAINRFLEGLPKEKRLVLVGRYWYFDSIKAISEKMGFSESKTKMILLRTREELKLYLNKEDKIQ